MYLLKRTDQGGGYVIDPAKSRGSSYTHNPTKAKRYSTIDDARADSCPGNEIPVNYESIVYA